MARQLSGKARLVLRKLGRSGKAIDELAVRTQISKTRLAKMLWDLRDLGWVSVSEEMRKLPVYRRVRLPARVAPGKRGKGEAPSTHIAALNAWLRIGVPVGRARSRRVVGPAE